MLGVVAAGAALTGSGDTTASRLVELLTFRAGYNATLVLLGTMLLGVASAVVGTFLLLRRRSLVADALSHAALPGVCIGFLIGWWLGFGDRSLLVLLAGAGLFGLLGVVCIHLIAALPRIHEDAAIGVVLSVFFAIGVVLLKLIEQLPGGNIAGLNRFIFGSAASMIREDLNVIMTLGAICLLVPILLYKELRLVCFDAGFARSIGRSTVLFDGLILALVTLVTLAGLHAVGAILMVALLVIPPAAARFWTDRLWVMLFIAAAIGAAGCWIGTACSVVIRDVPTGPAIVVACGGLFLVSMILAPRRGLAPRWWHRLRARRDIGRAHLLRAMYECIEAHEGAGLLTASHRLTAGGDRKPMADGREPAHDAASATVGLGELLRRRRWTAARLRRLLRAAVVRREILREGSRFRFTRRGIESAREVVRRHRLWEHYLATHADVHPARADRSADEIEHVLGHELVDRIEASLIRRGMLGRAGGMPDSPHRIDPTAD